MPPWSYEVTRADRATLPASRHQPGPHLGDAHLGHAGLGDAHLGHAHLGYDADERTRPFARYFRASTLPIQEHAREAILAGRMAPEYGYDVDDAVTRLERPGQHGGETGWTRLPGGITYVACRTDMPGVTAAMWDWWFGWHSTDPARYKLWHPDAHRCAALGEDRGADRALADRQRYLGNVSYVEEYLGGRLYRLAIRFVDPARLGFTRVPGGLYVCARVGFAGLPIAFGWLVHQIRPTADGSQMRSRFFLTHVALLRLPPRALSAGPLPRLLATAPARAVAAGLSPRLTAAGLPATIGPDVLVHCAAEMNHLASFLPQLHEEFTGTP